MSVVKESVNRGDVWESKDPRRKGRVTVLEVINSLSDGSSYAVVKGHGAGARRRKIETTTLKRFYRHLEGETSPFILEEPSPEEPENHGSE